MSESSTPIPNIVPPSQMESIQDIDKEYPRVMGCVKFFDNKAGYGFISVLKTDILPQFSEKDIFVHYSSIHIENAQYKYLVKGEYVSFRVMPVVKQSATGDDSATNGEKFNAVDITGIQGGKLMCETLSQDALHKTRFTTIDNTTMDIDMDNAVQQKDRIRRPPPPLPRNPYQQPQYTGRGAMGGGRGAGRGGRGGRGHPPARVQQNSNYDGDM